MRHYYQSGGMCKGGRNTEVMDWVDDVLQTCVSVLQGKNF